MTPRIADSPGGRPSSALPAHRARLPPTDSFLFDAFIYLVAAVVSVPIARRFGRGSVLGYLLAGVLIGPHRLSLVGDRSDHVMHFAEFGVVMMIGGAIPGVTKVASIALYDEVQRLDYASAHAFAATLLGLSFALLLVVTLLQRRRA